MEKKRTFSKAFDENGEEEEKSKDRRLSLRERKKTKHIKEEFVYDEDEGRKNKGEQEDLHSPITSDLGLPVRCGSKIGLLDVKMLQAGAACIKCDGQLLTPPAFEFLAGKSAAKKWKASIFYKKKPLKFWFEKGYLSTKGYKWGSRNGAKNIFQSNCEPEEVSEGDSDMGSEGDVKDVTWLSSSEDQEEETGDKREGSGKEGAAVNGEHPESKSEAINLENWDSDDYDFTDISGSSGDQTVIVEEEPTVISTTPEKLGLQKEPKIIIHRLPVVKSEDDTNGVEHPQEALGANAPNAEVTDDNSATLDDLYFTSVTQNQQSSRAGRARGRQSSTRPDQQIGIKTETPSYEEEYEELRMFCGNKDSEVRKKECLDVSISQYNNQQRAAEGGDLTSMAAPEQPLITENIFPPTLSPISKRLCVLVHQDHTHVAPQLQQITSDIRIAQTSGASDMAEASLGALPGSDEETMDLYQLKREKIKMQLRVLKLQAEYYNFKLSELKRLKN